jgi:hypothetical protein
MPVVCKDIRNKNIHYIVVRGAEDLGEDDEDAMRVLYLSAFKCCIEVNLWNVRGLSSSLAGWMKKTRTLKSEKRLLLYIV